ncbi:MAG: IS110 family transposase [Pseudonocardiaceae bacterium]
MRVLYERCAAIDVHKDQVTVAVRTPGDGPGRRQTEVRKFRAFYGVLTEMARWLVSLQVTHVAMEATGIYTMPVYHALIEQGSFDQVLVCNAAHVKNVPGRKTDAVDAVWLAELLECGLLRGSFIPEPKIKAVRDITRYRKKIVGARTSELQRLGSVLQDAGIKLDSVASSIATVSGRAMIEALIDGERRPAVLADLARGRMRSKIPDLTLALEGRFGAHHALMCQLHLEHIDHLDDMIARLDAQVEQMMIPFAPRRDLLITIPGIGPIAAAAIISEIGANPAEFFATDAHLASWAGLCPGNHESAGKRKHGTPRKGNQHLKPVLVEAAWSAVRTDGRLRARYHRLVLRFGGYRNPAAKKKAILAIAHTLMVIIWNVLASDSPYTDLGADFYDRRSDPERETRRLIAKLEALGHTVTIEPAAA